MDASMFHGDLVSASRILYTPSAFARTNLLHLQEIGELQAERPHTSKRSNLQSYLFLIVLSGSGTLTYQGAVYPLSAGQCAWIQCHSAYAHRTSHDLWKLQWIHFYGPTLDAIYEKYLEKGGSPVISTENTTAFSQQWQTLYETAKTFDHIRDMRINEQLCSLLTLLMAQSLPADSTSKPAPKRQNLQGIKDYLDLHYAEKNTLDDLAVHFFINKYYLTRIFHEQFGITINNYLTSVRVTQAKNLLRFSNMSLESIAKSCGLQNANYLNRVFKKLTGMGPSRYRQQWKSLSTPPSTPES